MLSTIDVIDAYLTGRPDTDFSTVTGRDLESFGERVREFSAHQTPEIDADQHPIYLGGWPSANFALLGGDMILSSLLYSGQVLVRDPIADWFSVEQYRVEHMMSARPGFHPSGEDAETRIRRTRAFLTTVVPQIMRMRPLIEAGIVVPVPSEQLYFQERGRIDLLRRDIETKLSIDPVAYATRFSAEEIATEDNVRGFFAMAPGPEPAPQIHKALRHGVRYFAREFTLADRYGVTYTAPFAHERYLCQEGVSPIVGTSNRVVEAILRSGLPVFHNLTPEVIRDVHDDDTFGEFRSTLHQVYQGTPVEDPAAATAYVRDQENALLRPLINEGEKAASRGLLARLGASLSQNKFAIAAALATDTIVGTLGAATAITVAGTFADDAIKSRRGSGPVRIWSALVAHTQRASDEVTRVQHAPAAVSIPGTPWGIPREPGMSISVTAGQLIWDADPRALADTDEEERSRLGVYGPCRCGSGQKFKFCCAGLR
ncbi:hypothetical protein [Microbacterium algeriense]|uniref:hypothetical protein n=1 Tax=Microbacterium algeriense TaxID=2615184 RepID=UPI0022E8B704|nr:hypothetical protein [Microbacterium algeriense]